MSYRPNCNNDNWWWMVNKHWLKKRNALYNKLKRGNDQSIQTNGDISIISVGERFRGNYSSPCRWLCRLHDARSRLLRWHSTTRCLQAGDVNDNLKSAGGYGGGLRDKFTSGLGLSWGGATTFIYNQQYELQTFRKERHWKNLIIVLRCCNYILVS